MKVPQDQWLEKTSPVYGVVYSWRECQRQLNLNKIHLQLQDYDKNQDKAHKRNCSSFI